MAYAHCVFVVTTALYIAAEGVTIHRDNTNKSSIRMRDPQLPYCVKIVTGSAAFNEGTIDVYITAGEGQFLADHKIHYASHDTVLEQCYGVRHVLVEVTNPTNDGWTGSVQYSMDGGRNYRGMNCTSCTDGMDTTFIVVDGNLDAVDQASTTCMNGTTCDIVPVGTCADTINPPEDQRLYSSVVESPKFNASELDSPLCWQPYLWEAGQWLQIDLGAEMWVYGVVTQGKHTWDAWTTGFYVKLSRNGVTFADVPGIFPGNTDRDTKVTNRFAEDIARYVRIVVQSWVGDIPAMRAGVIACEVSTIPISDVEPALQSFWEQWTLTKVKTTGYVLEKTSEGGSFDASAVQDHSQAITVRPGSTTARRRVGLTTKRSDGHLYAAGFYVGLELDGVLEIPGGPAASYKEDDTIRLQNEGTQIVVLKNDMRIHAWPFSGDTNGHIATYGKIFLFEEGSSLTVLEDRNFYRHTEFAGYVGGICVCPDGTQYEVGDNDDSCQSLACEGGSTLPNSCGHDAITKMSTKFAVACWQVVETPAPTQYPTAYPTQSPTWTQRDPPMQAWKLPVIFLMPMLALCTLIGASYGAIAGGAA